MKSYRMEGHNSCADSKYVTLNKIRKEGLIPNKYIVLEQMLYLTKIIAFEEQVLVHAELPAEGDEVLGVVAREEAAPRRALPAAAADLGHRLCTTQSVTIVTI